MAKQVPDRKDEGGGGFTQSQRKTAGWIVGLFIGVVLLVAVLS